ncbi:MAG: DUF1330 domain-containing protein [Pseudomonadota bacterium]
MKVVNEVQPSDPKQIAAMMEEGPAGPIFMVNLLRFKDKAAYEDGRPTDLSGREAYMLYGKEVAKLIKDFGGEVIFAGDVTILALGQVEDMWHEVAIASYPNRNALLRMATSQKWQDISVHRTAGLEGQLNIETVIRPAIPDQA